MQYYLRLFFEKMAASMSWDRFRRGGSTSPEPTERSSSLTAQVKSLCGLHYPLRTRCFELESLIRRSSSKDLNSIYPLFLDLVFGLNGHPGWGLNTLNSLYAKDDSKHLQDFMSPSGPVFLMVYKLQSDHYLRYEFPVDKLSAPTRASLASGIVPPFYQGKLNYQSHGRAPSVVMLNAFEYFMYIFAYYLVSDRVHKAMNNWTQPQDYFYPVLLDQYLCYFLRSDGRAVPPIPVTSSAPTPAANRLSPYRLPQYGVLYHYLHSSPYGGGEGGHAHQRSPTQHQDTTLGLHHRGMNPGGGGVGGGAGVSPGISFQQTIQDDPQEETWRSEVLVQALTEFWLNQNSLQMAEDKSFMTQVRENFIPSPDHVRMVRILVKRLHFFVNSARPIMHQSAYQHGGESAMEELKRYILPVFVQKPLYVFLRHGFDNWPLDSSFRQILELWLSYIQPWRYVEETSRTGFYHKDIHSPLRSHLGSSSGQTMNQQRESASTRSFPADDERWPRFVQENLPFYTVLFQELLPRIFHQDLSIPNNALMVYRMAKVFGQPHLSNVMKEAEEHLIDLLCHPSQPYGAGGGGGLSANPSFMSLSAASVPSSTHLPSTRLAMGTRLYTHLLEEEAPGYMYRPLFDASGAATIEQLLGFITQAQTTVKTMAGPSFGDITQTIKSFFTNSLRQANHSALFDDIGPVDTRKAEVYLQSSGEFFSEIFDVPLPHPEDTMTWNVGQIGRDQHLPPDMMDGQLTPLGKFQLMNRLRSSDVCFHGDPDLQPIRTFENAALVRVLHALSCQFNDAFGDKLLEVCSQGGLLGAMARWYFNPRGSPPSHACDPAGRAPSWYRPRLSLRFLANYRTLTFLAILYLLLVFVWDITPTGFVAFLLAAALFVGFLGSLYTYLRGDVGGGEEGFARGHQHHPYHQPVD